MIFVNKGRLKYISVSDGLCLLIDTSNYLLNSISCISFMPHCQPPSAPFNWPECGD